MIEPYSVKIYDRESFIDVVPFTRQKDGGEIIIGRLDTATFLAVPSGAVELLDHLANGESVGQAADLYYEQHGEVCDLDGLLAVLEIKGIVAPFGERTRRTPGITARTPVKAEARKVQAHAGQAKSPATKRYHFSNFPQPLARRIFSVWAIGTALVLISISLILLAQDPSLWPNRDDFYYTHQRTLKLAFLVVISYAGVLIHEFAHLIAARAVGVNSRISFGNRLYELVMEADLTLLWSIPKRRRYLPLMAGCLVDAATAALLILTLYANRRGWLVVSSASQLIRMAVLSYVARIAWQGAVFVRTDFYYVFAALLNCRSLLQDTEDYLRNQLVLFLPWIRIVDQSAIPAAERRVIRFYAVIWIAGRVLALYWLFAVVVPLVCRYGADLAKALEKYSEKSADFWDALALALCLVLPVLIGVIFWIRNLIASCALFRQRPLQNA